MFAHPLQQQKDSPYSADGSNEYTLSDRGYGKDCVKVLHVKRNGPVHSIKEVEVNTHLKLRSKKDFYSGDNSDIVATDSQKNTVYILAKKYGIENPERFALLLAKHFLSQYSHVEEAHIHVEEYPWERLSNERTGPNKSVEKHNHAFVFTPKAVRYCDVILRRAEPTSTVISGIKGLRVLKTTQSSFVDFVKDDYRSLPDMYDRIFSTIVDCSWEYSTIENVKFCQTWNTVRDLILKNFAGDLNTGIPSPSVQHTLYLTEKEVLDVIPQISDIAISFPNKHYYSFDTSKFQKLIPGENKEVFVPSDKPYGNIYAKLSRKDLRSRL